MQHIFTQYLVFILIGVLAVGLFSLVFAIAATVSTSGLRRRFRKWKSIHSTADLDDVYTKTLDEVTKVRAELLLAQQEMESLRLQLRSKVSSARLIRFNAFQDLGSDLSFSLALIDDEKNGVVLSSIYGREESRTYAKPVQAGSSRYSLTEEEMQVISQAAQKASGRQPVNV